MRLLVALILCLNFSSFSQNSKKLVFNLLSANSQTQDSVKETSKRSQYGLTCYKPFYSHSETCSINRNADHKSIYGKIMGKIPASYTYTSITKKYGKLTCVSNISYQGGSSYSCFLGSKKNSQRNRGWYGL